MLFIQVNHFYFFLEATKFVIFSYILFQNVSKLFKCLCSFSSFNSSKALFINFKSFQTFFLLIESLSSSSSASLHRFCLCNLYYQKIIMCLHHSWIQQQVNHCQFLQCTELFVLHLTGCSIILWSRFSVS